MTPEHKAGRGYCLGCQRYLSYCGKPFTADISCGYCGVVNVYVDSQQPSRIRQGTESASLYQRLEARIEELETAAAYADRLTSKTSARQLRDLAAELRRLLEE